MSFPYWYGTVTVYERMCTVRVLIYTYGILCGSNVLMDGDLGDLTAHRGYSRFDLSLIIG
jgi:hypothetical protein